MGCGDGRFTFLYAHDAAYVLGIDPKRDEIRATEGGMLETVHLGLFHRVAARTHEIVEHYDDPDELLETWSDDEEQWMSEELERRLRSAAGPVDVVERLVFHLYQRLES